MGTPDYMAPEQREKAKSVDHRADIFSLGVIFYEMLTGELPLGRFPVPSKKIQLDIRFDEVILKSLEKEPDLRYQRASHVSQDVSRISKDSAAGQPIPPAPPPAPESPAQAAHKRGTIRMPGVEVGPDGIRVGNTIHVGKDGIRICNPLKVNAEIDAPKVKTVVARLALALAVVPFLLLLGVFVLGIL